MASRSELPNIVLIMSDQMRATASHLYGNPFCETPALGRLADEGVLFEHAFTPHPLCVPARVSLWTSQYPHSHGCRRNETLMPGDALHAFQLWEDAGYRLGLIGKNHCFETAEDRARFDVYCDIRPDVLPRGMDWFRPPEGRAAVRDAIRRRPRQSPRFSYAVTDLPPEDHATGLIAGQAVRFLERHGDAPFALWVSFPAPHEPWVVPRRYAELFPSDRIQLPPWREGEFAGPEVPERNRVLYQILGVEEDPLADVYGVVGVYHGMVRFVDDGVGQIMAALARLGLREDTIVVFCADHGDFMGEHRMTCKGGVFYDCLTRVPLIVSWPGAVPQGERDDSMVSLVDIVPTLLRLQGRAVPRSMQGHALPTVVDAAPQDAAPQDAAPQDAAFAEYGAGGPPFTLADLNALPQPYGRDALMRSLQWREAEGRRKMVRTREWKYVHDPQGDADELYDLANDPWELTNVVRDPANRDVVVAMQRRLLAWSIATEDARPVPLPEVET
jgi:arylsulfatase A-like enzyme